MQKRRRELAKREGGDGDKIIRAYRYEKSRNKKQGICLKWKRKQKIIRIEETIG